MKNVFGSIARSSAIITGSRIILKALSLVSFYLIITALSRKDYGLITLALSVSGPVLALSGFGLDDLIVAGGARKRGEKKIEEYLPLYGGFALSKILLTGVIVALLFWIRSLLGGQYQELLNQFFIPLVVWIGITSIRALTDSTLQLFEHFGWFASANVIENCTRLLIVIGLFVTHRMSVPMVIWAYAGSKLIATLFSLPILRRIFVHGTGIIIMVRTYLSFVIGQGKWEVLRTLFGNLFSGIDQWIVGLFLGLEAVAILSIAGSLNSLLALVLPFRQILFPIMSRLSSESGATSFVGRRIAKYSVWFNTILIAGAAVVAPFAVSLVAPKYLAAVPVFDFLALSQIINALSTSHGMLFYALSEQKFLLKVSLLGTLSSLTALPLLTKLLGIYGTVLERHVSSLAILWLRERHLRRVHKITTFAFRDLFTFDAYDRDVLRRLRAGMLSRLRKVV